MKKGILIGLAICIAFSLSGCFYSSDNETGLEIFNAKMDKKVTFEADLDDYKTLELNIDLSVCGVTIESTTAKKLSFEQRATTDKLLAKMDESSKGDKKVLTFKNDQSLELSIKNKSSKAVIYVPENVEIILVSNLDVGELELDMDDLEMVEINASSDVGEIALLSKKDQKKLEYIRMETNVGEIDADFAGDLNALEELVASTDTGEVSIALKGNVKKALKVDIESNVGDAMISMGGSFGKDVKVNAKTDVGEIKIEIPKNANVEMVVDAPEFTAELDTNGIDFAKSKNKYRLDGKGSMIYLDLKTNIGDIDVQYVE